VIYCIGAKLFISILALAWALPHPEPSFLQGFAIGVLPIWSEALASYLTKFEPAREGRKLWLYLDAAVDAGVFLVAPLTWWGMNQSMEEWFYLSSAVFLGAGLFRIVRFLRRGIDNHGYFQGLPVTYTGYIWPLMTLAPSGLQPPLSAAILLLFGIAMALPHRFIKASR
jgi:hypothetical protein